MTILAKSVAQSLRDHLYPGGIGVIAARAGVGKSVCLVQLALTELVKENAVIHISLDNPVSHVRRWYDELIEGINGQLRSAEDFRLQVERNRHIHCYLDGGFEASRLSDSITFLREHSEFNPQLAVIDSFPFADAEPDKLREILDVAQKQKLEIWMSSLTHRHQTEENLTGLPLPLPPFTEWIDTVAFLEPESDGIAVRTFQRGRSEWTKQASKLAPRKLLFSDR